MREQACRVRIAAWCRTVRHVMHSVDPREANPPPARPPESPGVSLPTGSDARIQQKSFAGPHPAGLPGTHIHFLQPVSAQKSVWHSSLQDVVALGRTLLDGELFTQRVVALGGPAVTRPRLLRTPKSSMEN